MNDVFLFPCSFLNPKCLQVLHYNPAHFLDYYKMVNLKTALNALRVQLVSTLKTSILNIPLFPYAPCLLNIYKIQGRHALVYDMNTANETWEWVDLKEVRVMALFSTFVRVG